MNARDLIQLAERVFVISMPDNAHGSGYYRINDEETFVEQLAQHVSFKDFQRSQASGAYVLTFAADTPETEQLQWIAQVLSGTDLHDGHGGMIRALHV